MHSKLDASLKILIFSFCFPQFFAMICSARVKMCSSDLVFRCNRVLPLTELIVYLIWCIVASSGAQTGSPQITQQPANQYAFEGMTTRFSVVVVTGTPPVYHRPYAAPKPD